MTPKEKAEELVERFNLLQTYVEYFSYDHAKQCALICVDEIFKTVKSVSSNEIEYDDNYWQEVKTEIEKL